MPVIIIADQGSRDRVRPFMTEDCMHMTESQYLMPDSVLGQLRQEGIDFTTPYALWLAQRSTKNHKHEAV